LALAITLCGYSSKSSGAAAASNASPARLYIYWLNNQTIGHANLNGTEANQPHINDNPLKVHR
jgi:hypothetical protein